MKTVNEYTAIKQEGILLNANENYKNLEEIVRKEIAEAIYKMPFNRYPEMENPALLEAYSKYIGKPVEQIIAGNGSDEMLGLSIGLNIKNDALMYTTTLDFSMYDYYTSMYGGNVEKYEWKMGEEFDVDAFIRQGKEKNVDLVLFSNPNNPTGRLLDQDTIIKIVKGFAPKTVIVDEAYIEFCEGSVIDLIDEYDNLFVTRTLSKAFGLASARIGFLIGPKEKMVNVKKYQVPYNISRLNEIAGVTVLNHLDLVYEQIDYVKKERERMAEVLKNYKSDQLTIYPSNTNFFYGYTNQKEKLLKTFEEHDITIRNYRDPYTFRITVGQREENDLVLSILKELGE